MQKQRLFRQSSRDRRTVDATRNPLACQSVSGTSVALRGGADVTTAATASAPSSQNTSTGRFFDALWSVKTISATQNSPGWICIVQPVVFGGVTSKECVVRADERSRGFVERLNGDHPFPGTDGVNKRRRQDQLLARLDFDLAV